MRAHLTNIHWHVRHGFDCTNLPLEAIVPMDGEWYATEEEFIEEMEEKLLKKHRFIPFGFTWELLESNIQ